LINEHGAVQLYVHFKITIINVKSRVHEKFELTYIWFISPHIKQCLFISPRETYIKHIEYIKLIAVTAFIKLNHDKSS